MKIHLRQTRKNQITTSNHSIKSKNTVNKYQNPQRNQNSINRHKKSYYLHLAHVANSTDTTDNTDTTVDDNNTTENQNTLTQGYNISKNNHNGNNTNLTSTNNKQNQSSNVGIIVGVVLGLVVVIVIAIVIYIYYRRRKNYQQYSRQPEQNIKKPSYNMFQQMRIKDLKFELYDNQAIQKEIIKKSNIKQQGQKKQIKEAPPAKKQFLRTQIKTHAQGFYQQVIVQENKDKEWCSLKFNKVISQNCYFQIEALTDDCQLAIGYIYEDNFQKTLANYKKNCKFTTFGVGINTNGIVEHFGKQRCQFDIDCDYGDVLGIAITKETIPKEQFRVWFTFNGKLLNQSLNQEKEKWEDINIKQRKQEANQDGFIVGKIKKIVSFFVPKPQILIQKQTKSKEERVNEDRELQKKKITLSENKFKYIPMISISKSSVFNINFGGENFRFQQPEFKKGLLV